MVYEQFEIASKVQLVLGQITTGEAQAKAGIIMCNTLEELHKYDSQITEEQTGFWLPGVS